MDGLDFGERVAQIGERLGHLFGVAPGVEFGFLEQAEPARQVVDHFLPAGLEFHLAAARFLQRGALAFQLLLRALQFGQLLLGFDHFRVHLLARRRALRPRPRRRRSRGWGILCA